MLTCKFCTGQGSPDIENATNETWNISGLSSGFTVSKYSADKNDDPQLRSNSLGNVFEFGSDKLIMLQVNVSHCQLHKCFKRHGWSIYSKTKYKWIIVIHVA